MNNNEIINFILNQCQGIQSRGNTYIDEILRNGNGKEVVKEFLESLRYVADDIGNIINKKIICNPNNLPGVVTSENTMKKLNGVKPLSEAYNSNKYIYNEILKMEQLYNNTSMATIKENLYQIKKQRKQKYVDYCKRYNMKVETYRLFEELGISLSSERAYTNPAHPSKILFIDLIRICNYLKIPLEEITAPVKEREKRPSYFKKKWNEELITQFINDYDNNIEIATMANKYDISLNSVIRYYKEFKKNKTTHSKLRIDK